MKKGNLIIIYCLICIVFVVGLFLFMNSVQNNSDNEDVLFQEKTYNFSLNGPNTIEIEEGKVYFDQGYSLSGDEVKVKIENNVDVDKPGVYYVDYYVDGKKVESRKVIVKEKKKDDDEEKSNNVTFKLNGDKKVELYYGDKYNDPGFIAKDDLGNDLSSYVKITNNIDYSQIGSYTIKYVISFNGYNETLERDIVIKAKETANLDINFYLKGDESISINVGDKFNDPLYSAIGTDGKDYSSYVKVSGSVNNNVSGTYTLTYKLTYYDISKTLYRKVVVNSVDVVLSTKSLSLVVGSSASISSNVQVSFKSSNTSVAIVDSNGKVTAKGVGSAIITATNKDGRSASCSVVVVNSEIMVQSLSLNKTSININVGKTEKLIVSILPSNATNKNITWSSSNTSVATVDSSGNVKALKKGSVIISAKSNNGKVATCTVNVSEMAVTKLTLNKTSESIYKTKTLSLIATITPTDASDKTITWKSSNTNIATVSSNGVVTGKKAGVVNITATSSNGKSATCKITVKDYTPVTQIKINKSSGTSIVGGTFILTATISPSNATIPTVTWTSSDKKVATVDKNGRVLAVGKGSATITANTADGKKATFKITVSSKSLKSVNIATFNIGAYHCGSSKISCNPTAKKIGTLLKNNKVDIVGFQEGGSDSNAKVVLSNAGLKSYYRIAPVSADIIFSRYDFSSKKYYSLSSCGEARVVQKTVIKINGVNVSVYNTHLGLRNCNESHYQELAKIVSSDSNPVVILGDYNSTDITKYNKYLKPLGAEIAAYDTSTHNMWKKKSYCDSVFIISKGHIAVSGSKTVDAYGSYSDHNMVIANLKIG